AVVAARRMRIAEDAGRDLAVRVRILAEPEEVALAEVATPARDVERDDDPVAPLQVAHARTDLLDDAGELVAEGAPHAGVRDQPPVEVQIRAAERRCGHTQDHVVRVLDPGVRLVLDPELRRTTVGYCPHTPLLEWVVARCAPRPDRASCVRRGGTGGGWHGRCPFDWGAARLRTRPGARPGSAG